MIEGLGHILKTARKRAGLTQDNVSELTGIARSTISDYEKDAIDDPSSASLRKLASVYRVDINYLFGIEPKQILVVDDLSDEDFKIVQSVVEKLSELSRLKSDN